MVFLPWFFWFFWFFSKKTRFFWFFSHRDCFCWYFISLYTTLSNYFSFRSHCRDTAITNQMTPLPVRRREGSARATEATCGPECDTLWPPAQLRQCCEELRAGWFQFYEYSYGRAGTRPGTPAVLYQVLWISVLSTTKFYFPQFFGIFRDFAKKQYVVHVYFI